MRQLILAGHERRQFAQPLRPPAEGSERAIGGVAQLGGELPRAGRSAERHERRLLDVLAHRLAGDGGIAFDVEQVVDDLEREPEVLRERLKRGDRFGRRTARSSRRPWPRR